MSAGRDCGLHPSQTALLEFFKSDHLPDDLRVVSESFADLAHDLEQFAIDGWIVADAELTTALRKLLEAKDCAVRAALGART